jgi:carboxymethylenebutenolidase
MRDTRALLAFIASQPGVQGLKVGCVGYCLGGRLALTAAGFFPDRIHSAASLHGSRLAGDQSDSPHLLAAKVQAELYVGVAEKDHLAGPAATAKLEAAYQEAGVRHEIEIYPGTGHGFVTDDAPVYDKAASEHHFERVLALFARNLDSVWK